MFEKNNPQKLNLTKTKLLIYGQPKVGKTTFAAQNPKAIILDCDNNGSAFVECYRLPVFSWQDLRHAIDKVVKEGKEMFETIVIDTVDNAYSYCRAEVCKENGVEHESEDRSYGRLWDMVKKRFLAMISYINSQGFGLWLISHSITKEAKISGITRSITTTSLTQTSQRLITSIVDHIVYIDQLENGQRKMIVLPEDCLEAGGRLVKLGLDQNFVFNSEAEAYEFMKKSLEGGK